MPASPPTIVDWLTKAGPYAVTLLVLLWLKLERSERLSSQTEVKTLYGKMLAERGESVKAMADFGEAVRDRLREHDERIDKTLELVVMRRR